MKYLANSYIIKFLIIFSGCVSAEKYIQQTDTNQTDTNQTDTNQTDTNQTDTNQTDTNIVLSELSDDEKKIAYKSIGEYYKELEIKIRIRTQELASKQTPQYRKADALWNTAVVRRLGIAAAKKKMNKVWESLDDAVKIDYLKGTLKTPDVDLFDFMYQKCEHSFGKERLQEVLTTTAAKHPQLALRAPLQIGALLPLVANTANYAKNREITEGSLYEFFSNIQNYFTGKITSGTLFEIYGVDSEGKLLIYLVNVDEYRHIMSKSGSKRQDIHVRFDDLAGYHNSQII